MKRKHILGILCVVAVFLVLIGIDIYFVSTNDTPGSRDLQIISIDADSIDGVTLNVSSVLTYDDSIWFQANITFPKEMQNKNILPQYEILVDGRVISERSGGVEVVQTNPTTGVSSYIFSLYVGAGKFEDGTPVTLAFDCFSSQNDTLLSRPLKVSWETPHANKSIKADIDCNTLRGSLSLTPFSLHLSLDTLSYTSFDALARDIKLHDVDGELISAPMTYRGSQVGDCFEITFVFFALLELESIHHISIGEDTVNLIIA